jgi:hypothetical protein
MKSHVSQDMSQSSTNRTLESAPFFRLRQARAGRPRHQGRKAGINAANGTARERLAVPSPALAGSIHVILT